MNSSKPSQRFQSPLASLLEAFLRDKRSRGFQYSREEQDLLQLDRFLVEVEHTEVSLPRHLAEGWLAKTSYRRGRTNRRRLGIVRQLAAFLVLQGCPAFQPPRPHKTSEAYSTARIFSRDEIRRILHAADCLTPRTSSPLRHLVIPELFRILYGCGLRAGEAVRLTIADVDLVAGTLRIRQGKFRRDRLVPVAPTVQERFKAYAAALGARGSEEPFFPSPRGGFYQPQSIYRVFRELLRSAGIAHSGRNQGPRLHEIRHSFAVHRLEQWYRAGEDLSVKLPYLATYMGHTSMAGTQWYLRLTQAIFTDLAIRLDNIYGNVIPKEIKP